MHTCAIVSVAVLALASIAAPARSDDAGGPTDGSSRRPLPPPIVPTRWLLVPASAPIEVDALVVRFALDPAARKPEAGASSDHPWIAFEGTEPRDALVAFTTVVAERDEVRMAKLAGAEIVFVNGEGFVGDVERRGYGGVPVLLRRGENRLLVTGIRGTFALELVAPATRCVIGDWDLAWSGYGSDPELEGYGVSFPVFNASSAPTNGLHVHSGPARPSASGPAFEPREWNDQGTIAPLGIRLATGFWYTLADGPPDVREAEVGSVSVWAEGDTDAARRILTRDATHAPRRDGVFTPRDVDRRPKSWIARRYEPHLYVYGTRGSRDETAALLARARLDQEFAWYRTRGTPLVVSDDEWLANVPAVDRIAGATRDGTVRTVPIVLYGNASSNAAWRRLVPEGSPIDARDGELAFRGRTMTGAALFGWFRVLDREGEPTPHAAAFSTGVSGARAGQLVHPYLHGVETHRNPLLPADPPRFAAFAASIAAPTGRFELDVRAK